MWWNGSIHRALLLHIDIRWLLCGKALQHLLQLEDKLTFFSHGITFLFERMTARHTRVIHTWIIGRYFLKDGWVESVVSSKKEMVYATMIKLELSGEHWNFGELVSVQEDAILSLCLECFLIRLVGIIYACDFWYCISIWKICTTQWNNIFQNNYTWCY